MGIHFVRFCHEKHLYNKRSPLVKFKQLFCVYWLFGFSFQWSITVLQQLDIHILKRNVLFQTWRMLNIVCVLTESFHFIPLLENFVVIFKSVVPSMFAGFKTSPFSPNLFCCCCFPFYPLLLLEFFQFTIVVMEIIG